MSLKEAWAMDWPPIDTEAKLFKDEQTHRSTIFALGIIASSLPMFNFAPEQTVMGVSSLWKMWKGLPLDEVRKNAAFALAAQQAALATVAKFRANVSDNEKTNPIPPKYQMKLVDIAQRESADPYSLAPEDWKTLENLTDNTATDFHPDADTFYMKAKVVADNVKSAAVGSANAIRFIQQNLNVVPQAQNAAASVGVTRTYLQDIGFNTLQTLILNTPNVDAWKIPDTLGIQMPKKAMDEKVTKTITASGSISKTQEVQRNKPPVHTQKHIELKMWVIGAVIIFVLGSMSEIFRKLLFCTLCIWIVIGAIWLFLIPTAWMAKKFPDTAENVLEVIKFVIGAVFVVIVIMFIMQLIQQLGLTDFIRPD